MKDNTSDDNLEKALDDIFGNDFLEIELEDSKDNNIGNKTSVIQGIDKDYNISSDEKKEPLIKKNKKLSNNIFTILLVGLIIIIIALLAIYLPGYLENKEYVVNCSFNVSDKGYSITDEYKITYKNNKLEYLDGKYKYTALTDEYKPQIEFVKNEKLPAIINSNGMDGFTYIYESSDDYFSVNSYLDITKFDFNIVDKNNNKSNPLSYVNINSKTTYKSLIKYFEKNKYKCVKSR